MGLLVCGLVILAQAAIIAAVFYLAVWIIGLIFEGAAVPPRVVQLLAVALLIYALLALIVCFSGSESRLFGPWIRP
jgi:hypothetical protein